MKCSVSTPFRGPLSSIGLLTVALAFGATAGACNSANNEVATKASAASRRVAITVHSSGYEPETVTARAGEPLTLVFTRTTKQGCGEELVFPEHDIRRDLPLGQEVEVELTAKANETIAFTCGMGMYKGSVVATAR